MFRKPPGATGPGTFHLHRETERAYLDQATAEQYVYHRPKKKAKGRWVWEVKAEGRANHYGDTLFGAFAIADIKNFRLLQPREVVKARRSMETRLREQQQRGAGGAAGGGVRMPDGRPFLATRR